MFSNSKNHESTNGILVEHSGDELEDSSFFSWSNIKATTTISVENEVSQYLNRSLSKKFNSLNEYPNIKKSFFCYNTPLPISASIKRVFSVSNALLTKRRGKRDDNTFKNTVFLKYNYMYNSNLMEFKFMFVYIFNIIKCLIYLNICVF